MNFPLEEPVYRFFFWLMNTPGLGGVAVGLILVLSFGIFASALTWIALGGQADEPETYVYPTPALHQHP